MLISIIVANGVSFPMVRISRGMRLSYATGFLYRRMKKSTSALCLQEGSAFLAQEHTPFFAAVIFLYFFFDFVLL